MHDRALVAQLEAAQRGSQEDFVAFVERFRPLLRKYAKYLGDDDAYHDLQAFLVELLLKVNPSHFADDRFLLAYIKRCVVRRFGRLYERRRRREVLFFEDLPQGALRRLECEQAQTDDYFADAALPVELLTLKEREIIQRHVILGYSVAEIAKEQGVSRQSVNQVKNRALKKLKTHYEEEAPGR